MGSYIGYYDKLKGRFLFSKDAKGLEDEVDLSAELIKAVLKTGEVLDTPAYIVGTASLIKSNRGGSRGNAFVKKEEEGDQW